MTRRAAKDEEPREKVVYQGEVWEVVKLVMDGRYAYIERSRGKDYWARFAPIGSLTAVAA